MATSYAQVLNAEFLDRLSERDKRFRELKAVHNKKHTSHPTPTEHKQLDKDIRMCTELHQATIFKVRKIKQQRQVFVANKHEKLSESRRVRTLNEKDGVMTPEEALTSERDELDEVLRVLRFEIQTCIAHAPNIEERIQMYEKWRKEILAKLEQLKRLSLEERCELNYIQNLQVHPNSSPTRDTPIERFLGIFKRKGEFLNGQTPSGLFAKCDIFRGEYIGQYRGKVVSTKCHNTYSEALAEKRAVCDRDKLNRFVVVTVPSYDLENEADKYVVVDGTHEPKSILQYIRDTTDVKRVGNFNMTPNCIMDNYGRIWAKTFIPGDSPYRGDYPFLSELRMHYGDNLL